MLKLFAIRKRLRKSYEAFSNIRKTAERWPEAAHADPDKRWQWIHLPPATDGLCSIVFAMMKIWEAVKS